MLKYYTFCLAILFALSDGQSQTSEQPNILLIMTDDLNYLGMGSLVDSTVKAPNIDTLLSESYVFTNAHANAAGCGPSRASMFSGVLPQTSGHTGYKMSQNSWVDNPMLGASTSVFEHFLNNGYNVYASGKLYHSYRYREEDFTFYKDDLAQGPYAVNNQIHSDLPESFSQYDLSFAQLENIPSYNGVEGWQNKFGTPFFFEDDENRDLMADEITVEYCTNLLDSLSAIDSDEPFFLSAGFFNPHQPFHVPAKYWDLYDSTDFDLDFLRPDTALPILTTATNRFGSSSNEAYDLMRAESPADDPDFYFRRYVHAYYASVSFIDDQIGALLTALENSDYSDNTIIVFTSDHGFHLGSKGLVEKSTMWNDATAVPFAIRIPTREHELFDKPVSLVDLYPTLIDYANLEPPSSHALDGKSVKGIISGQESNTAIISGVSIESLQVGELSEVEHSHHAYLKGRFKYLHYSSGEDELYDIKLDFRETNDLSENPDYQILRNSMYKELRERIGFIRPPTQSYVSLYYGDFTQDLNGWRPSEVSDEFMISEGNEQIASRHLKINGNTTTAIFNDNITFRQEGSHRLDFMAYAETTSEEEEEPVRVRIVADSEIILDEIIQIGGSVSQVSLPFDMFEPFPAFGKTRLFIQSQSSMTVHLDDIKILNQDISQEALFPCLFAENMQTGVPIGQLQPRFFSLPSDQSAVSCVNSTGSSPQLWQKFVPNGETGVVAAQILAYNPVIEVFSDCSLDLNLVSCVDDQVNEREFNIMYDLVPGQEYYARITSKRNLPIFATQSPGIKSIFFNFIPAVLAGSNLQVKSENSDLHITHSSFSEEENYEITFLFEDNFSGEKFHFNISPDEIPRLKMSHFNLPIGTAYKVSLGYRLPEFELSIPYGPAKTIYYVEGSLTDSDFSIYPNPLQMGKDPIGLKFTNKEDGMGKIIILDLLGKMVYQKSATIESSQVSVPSNFGLSQGTYVILFEENGIRSTPELLFMH
ncbi:MAG TPA: sulfatase-like hydrolase/transferase [Cryomorphaceae bacterium]|nr:sulfatase-like hydrolase/transferase [Cryomorphaceae bacterium]